MTVAGRLAMVACLLTATHVAGPPAAAGDPVGDCMYAAFDPKAVNVNACVAAVGDAADVVAWTWSERFENAKRRIAAAGGVAVVQPGYDTIMVGGHVWGLLPEGGDAEPIVAAGPSGIPAVYRTDRLGDLVLSRWSPSTASWVDTPIPAPEGAQVLDPRAAIAVDGAEGVHVVVVDSARGRIYYGGATESGPFVWRNVHRGQGPVGIAASGSKLAYAFVGGGSIGFVYGSVDRLVSTSIPCPAPAAVDVAVRSKEAIVAYACRDEIRASRVELDTIERPIWVDEFDRGRPTSYSTEQIWSDYGPGAFAAAAGLLNEAGSDANVAYLHEFGEDVSGYRVTATARMRAIDDDGAVLAFKLADGSFAGAMVTDHSSGTGWDEDANLPNLSEDKTLDGLVRIAAPGEVQLNLDTRERDRPVAQWLRGEPGTDFAEIRKWVNVSLVYTTGGLLQMTANGISVSTLAGLDIRGVAIVSLEHGRPLSTTYLRVFITSEPRTEIVWAPLEPESVPINPNGVTVAYDLLGQPTVAWATGGLVTSSQRLGAWTAPLPVGWILGTVTGLDMSAVPAGDGGGPSTMWLAAGGRPETVVPAHAPVPERYTSLVNLYKSVDTGEGPAWAAYPLALGGPEHSRNDPVSPCMVGGAVTQAFCSERYPAPSIAVAGVNHFIVTYRDELAAAAYWEWPGILDVGD